MSSDFVIGVGGNLGARETYLCSGLSALNVLSGVRISALSSVYESDAVGPVQGRYLNAAARVVCELSPHALLERLLAIEQAQGRTRTLRTLRWGPRTLDLDILWGPPLASPELDVPHAQLLERSFALAPLLDVAPELAVTLGPRLLRLGGAPARIGGLVLDSEQQVRLAV